MSGGLTGRQWTVLLTASIGALLEIIGTSITNVALISIQANLGATLAEVGWVVTGYAMATVVMIPLSSRLSEQFGQRSYFVFCLAGFTIASVLCGLAPNLGCLIARGVTTVMMFLPLSLATLGPLPREEVGAGSGFYSLSRQLGGTFGIALLTLCWSGAPCCTGPGWWSI